MSVSVCRHGCARGLCVCRPVSVRTRVLHTPPPYACTTRVGVPQRRVGIRPGGGGLWDLCMSPHTRVCTRGGCVCTDGLHPLPGHPWGASRRGVNTAPTARGGVGKAAAPRPQLRRGTPPATGLPLRAGRRAAGGGPQGALPSPPRVFVEGGTALPSLRERQAKQPAAGRGARKKQPGVGIHPPRPGRRGGGGTSRAPSPPQNLRTAAVRRGERGKRPGSPECGAGCGPPASPAAAALQRRATCRGMSPSPILGGTQRGSHPLFSASPRGAAQPPVLRLPKQQVPALAKKPAF